MTGIPIKDVQKYYLKAVGYDAILDTLENVLDKIIETNHIPTSTELIQLIGEALAASRAAVIEAVPLACLGLS